MTMSAKKQQELQLLDAFIAAAKLQGRTVDPQKFTAEIMTHDREITAQTIVEVAKRFDLIATLDKRFFKKITFEDIPTILILKNGDACLLLDVDNETYTAKVQYFGTENLIKMVSIDALEESYSGDCLIIKAYEPFEERADDKKMFKMHYPWFWGTMMQFSSFYSHVILAALLINIFTIIFPLYVMNVYDRVVPNNATDTLWVLTFGVFLAFLFDFLLKTLRAYFVDVANKKVDIILSSRLLKKTLDVRMADQPASVSVRANHLKDFESVRDFFSSLTLAGVVDLPFMVIFIAVIFFVGGALAIVPIVSVVIITIMSLILSIPLYNYVSQSFVGSSQKTAILHEALSAVEVVKSNVSYGDILSRWRHYSVEVAELALKSRFFSTLAVNMTGFVTQFSNIAVVVFGVYLIHTGTLSIGGLIACTMLTGRCLAPLGQVTSILIRLQQTRCSLKALDDIMALTEERSEEKTYVMQSAIVGAVELDQVAFHYADQNVDFLKDISFKITPGEKVAILGNMGSGKSTILKLIMNFYEPTQGMIRIDDIAIDQWDPHHLRRSVGYLEQSPKLLFGTAIYNVTLKHPDAPVENIQRAIDVSGAARIFSRHPDGINMKIAEQGKGLSGGQVQSIALARTLVGDPKILLLDEPTSEMDQLSEQEFIQKMPAYLEGRTLIMVTHKQSLLRIVDRIIVLHNGKVLMDGAKNEVLGKIQESVSSERRTTGPEASGTV